MDRAEVVRSSTVLNASLGDPHLVADPLSHVSGDEEYEVVYLASKFQLTIPEVRELTRKHGNERENPPDNYDYFCTGSRLICATLVRLLGTERPRYLRWTREKYKLYVTSQNAKRLRMWSLK